MNHNQSDNRRDWAWPFWPVVPLYPYGHRPTLRTEVVKDTVWTFEQTQGIFYVVVPVRMTVVRLQPRGLLVYSPVAPTPECMRLMRELEQAFGPVQYIILSTVSGIEHKVFVGPFARRFPQAQVFVTPNQWSYPLNLPLPWLGLPRDRTQPLPADSSQAPFADQVDYALLDPIDLGLGPFSETACFHRASRTLMVTDALVSVPAEPPAVVQLEPFPPAVSRQRWAARCDGRYPRQSPQGVAAHCPVCLLLSPQHFRGCPHRGNVAGVAAGSGSVTP
jgi:hypothetical protein